jgi:hypothetical protein
MPKGDPGGHPVSRDPARASKEENPVMLPIPRPVRPDPRPLLSVLVLSLGLGACATAEGDGGPSVMKTPQEEVPAAVQAIERMIETQAALVADDVTIYCSRNYEWDVSLSGQDVTPQRPDGDEQVCAASGQPRAVFRNLDIRARNRIVFRRSGFDVVPFIRITASGNAAYALPVTAGAPADVRRARTIQVNDAQLRFFDEEAPQAAGPPVHADGSVRHEP